MTKAAGPSRPVIGITAYITGLDLGSGPVGVHVVRQGAGRTQLHHRRYAGVVDHESGVRAPGRGLECGLASKDLARAPDLVADHGQHGCPLQRRRHGDRPR